MNTRMTKVDWDILSHACALLACDVDSDPDSWDGLDWQRIERTHEKVHERLRRATRRRPSTGV